MGKTVLESSTASLMGIAIQRPFPGIVPDADEPLLYHCTHWFVSSQNNFCLLIQNTCLASFIFMDFDFHLLNCWTFGTEGHLRWSQSGIFLFHNEIFVFLCDIPREEHLFSTFCPPDIQGFFTVSKMNFYLSMLLIQGSGAFSFFFFFFFLVKKGGIYPKGWESAVERKMSFP